MAHERDETEAGTSQGRRYVTDRHGLTSALVELAEDRGFEPLRLLHQHDFQSCALGH